MFAEDLEDPQDGPGHSHGWGFLIGGQQANSQAGTPLQQCDYRIADVPHCNAGVQQMRVVDLAPLARHLDLEPGPVRAALDELEVSPKAANDESDRGQNSPGNVDNGVDGSEQTHLTSSVVRPTVRQ
jgi:hypothetical protein